MSTTPETASAGRDYANQSQMNLIAIVDYLGRRENLLRPVSIKDVTEVLPSINRDAAFRTLQTLAQAGWVENLGAGYMLSPDLTRLADRLRLRLIELNRLYLETTAS